MFSRNHNTPQNYMMEQKRNKTLFERRFYEYSPNGPAITTHLQGNGLGIAKLHPRHLSTNYIEVDNFLKGIGSCNFVSPTPEFQHQPISNTFLNMHDRNPILLPDTFVMYPNQRPM